MRHPPATGTLSARIHGAESVMRHRAETARIAARQLDADSPAAAALRGKAQGYFEAADLLRRLNQGNRLPKRNKELAQLLDHRAALMERLAADADKPAFPTGALR